CARSEDGYYVWYFDVW
nr:immunoglobulin heavy chain junction region [Mus musculus]